MVVFYYDPKYNFFELFNPQNGTLIRFDSSNSKEIYEPTQRSFPELLDIGVMGHCTLANYRICSSAGVKCYQNGALKKSPNMTIEDFNIILKQIEHRAFQISLGGAGDPNKHSNFEEILYSTRERMIVPNLTTSGNNITDKEISTIKKYCGGVAVSWYSRLDSDNNESNYETIRAANALIEAGCNVNIQYVVSPESLNDICRRLEYNLFPSGVSAVIFLLHKPVGLGNNSPIIDCREEQVRQFFSLVDRKHPFRIGFDTCFSPLLIQYLSNVLPESIDFCEAGKFSMYIDSQMRAYPCSFAIDSGKYSLSLREYSIDDIWNSSLFEEFRNINKHENCAKCDNIEKCHGLCPLGLTEGMCHQG